MCEWPSVWLHVCDGQKYEVHFKHAGKLSHRGDGNTNLEFLTPGPGILDQTHTGNNYDVVTGEGKHNMAINMWKQEHKYHVTQTWLKSERSHLC